MTSTVFLEDSWISINETGKGEGYTIHKIICKVCNKEILRYIEKYKIDQADWRKHYPVGIEIVLFDQCEHHNIVKSQKPPEIYEYKIEDYYIIPK